MSTNQDGPWYTPKTVKSAMTNSDVLKHAMAIPLQGGSWNPATNGVTLPKPQGVKLPPGPMNLKPGETVSAAPPPTPATPAVNLPTISSAPAPVSSTPITPSFKSTPMPKSGATAVPPAVTQGPQAAPPGAGQPPPVIPADPPQPDVSTHQAPTDKAAMTHAELLERAGLFVWR
jgi:hypothetical protein